jgi:hypothetical protein
MWIPLSLGEAAMSTAEHEAEVPATESSAAYSEHDAIGSAHLPAEAPQRRWYADRRVLVAAAVAVLVAVLVATGVIRVGSRGSVSLAIPPTVDGIPANHDPRLATLTAYETQDLRAAVPNSTDTVAGVYGSAATGDLTSVAAALASTAPPHSVVDIMGDLPGGPWTTHSVDAGPLGGSVQRASGEVASVSTVLYVWIDKQTIGMVAFYVRDPGTDLDTEFQTFRSQIEHQN